MSQPDSAALTDPPAQPATVDVNLVYLALAEEHGRAIGELTHLRLLRAALEQQVRELSDEIRRRGST
jgi:hypothetical protein